MAQPLLLFAAMIASTQHRLASGHCWRAWPWAAAWVLSCLGCSADGLGTDHQAIRAHGGHDTAAIPAIGVLDMGPAAAFGYCTATAIGPRAIITAAHCIGAKDEDDEDGYAPWGHVFRLPDADGVVHWDAPDYPVVSWRTFKLDEIVEVETETLIGEPWALTNLTILGNDIVLGQLEVALPPDLDYPDVGGVEASSGTTMVVRGYGNNGEYPTEGIQLGDRTFIPGNQRCVVGNTNYSSALQKRDSNPLDVRVTDLDLEVPRGDMQVFTSRGEIEMCPGDSGSPYMIDDTIVGIWSASRVVILEDGSYDGVATGYGLAPRLHRIVDWLEVTEAAQVPDEVAEPDRPSSQTTPMRARCGYEYGCVVYASDLDIDPLRPDPTHYTDSAMIAQGAELPILVADGDHLLSVAYGNLGRAQMIAAWDLAVWTLVEDSHPVEIPPGQAWYRMQCVRDHCAKYRTRDFGVDDDALLTQPAGDGERCATQDVYLWSAAQRRAVISPVAGDGTVEVGRFADGWTFGAVEGCP